MNSKAWTLFLIVAAFLIAFIAIFHNSNAALKNLQRAGDREIPTDSSYVQWWNRGSRCLGIQAPYDKKLRYFVGKTIPKNWDSANDNNEKYRYTIQGSADTDNHLILLRVGFERDSTLIVHEQLHVYLKVGGHPQKYYGDSIAARCGITPGHD